MKKPTRESGSGADVEWGRLRRPCTLKDRAKGCPHHPRTGTNSAPRLHGLSGLIRHIVGTIPCGRPGACVVRLPPPTHLLSQTNIT